MPRRTGREHARIDVQHKNVKANDLSQIRPGSPNSRYLKLH